MIDTLPLPIKVIAIVLLVCGAAAWGLIELRVWRGKPVLPYEPRRPVPWSGIDLLLALGIYLGSQAVCIAAAIHWVGGEGEFAEIVATPRGQLAMLAAAGVAGVLAFFTTAALVVIRAGASSEDLGFNLRAVPRDIFYGFVAFAAAAPVVYFIQYFFQYVVKIEYDHPLIEAFQEQAEPAAIGILLFTAVIAAPLVEEFLVRVLLQGWLEKLEMELIGLQPGKPFGERPLDASNESAESEGEPLPKTAPNSLLPTGLAGLPLGTIPILVSSLLFALMHLGQGAAPVPLFFYALVLGFLYQRTHRILPSIVAHFALNSLSMAMLFFVPVPVGN